MKNTCSRYRTSSALFFLSGYKKQYRERHSVMVKMYLYEDIFSLIWSSESGARSIRSIWIRSINVWTRNGLGTYGRQGFDWSVKTQPWQMFLMAEAICLPLWNSTVFWKSFASDLAFLATHEREGVRWAFHSRLTAISNFTSFFSSVRLVRYCNELLASMENR